MIFKLHYWCLTAGASALGILLGAFIETYTDASSLEIGSLFMIMPFLALIFRPIICSYADRQQAHREYMIWCLFLTALSYCPFVIIPMLGESFYGEHPRLCWYLLLLFKVFGDIAFGGVISIGDSMAINYSRRVGTQFAVYRIWGTISWIVFGLIIGQVNEIWFLPKYVPAFMILILCSLIDMSLFWLWPNEYFLMLTEEEIEKEAQERKLKYPNESTAACNFSLTKSLMPKEVVWAHMKAKMCSLFGCGCLSQKSTNEQLNNDEPKEFNVDPVTGTKTNSLARNIQEKQANVTSQDVKHLDEVKSAPIDKITQLKTLFLLIRRDVRILGYCQIFILGGLHSMATYFFFINLNIICNQHGLCNYSSLGGMLQATMASAETIVFIYIKDIQNFTGRVNLAGFALLLLTIKFGFYAFAYHMVNPHWALLVEVIQGIVFGIFLTQQVETAHMFANEVQCILPELSEKRIITDENQGEKIKRALSATMQAFMSNAEQGIGRGFGALFYGIIIQKYSYRVLWTILAFVFAISCIITFIVNIGCNIFKIEVGLKKDNNKTKQLQSNNVVES